MPLRVAQRDAGTTLFHVSQRLFNRGARPRLHQVSDHSGGAAPMARGAVNEDATPGALLADVITADAQLLG